MSHPLFPTCLNNVYFSNRIHSFLYITGVYLGHRGSNISKGSNSRFLLTGHKSNLLSSPDAQGSRFNKTPLSTWHDYPHFKERKLRFGDEVNFGPLLGSRPQVPSSLCLLEGSLVTQQQQAQNVSCQLKSHLSFREMVSWWWTWALEGFCLWLNNALKLNLRICPIIFNLVLQFARHPVAVLG